MKSVFDFMTDTQIADVGSAAGGMVTEALRQAFSYAATTGAIFPALLPNPNPLGLLQVGTKPTLFFPRGIYRISGSINNGQEMTFLTLVGEDAIIVMDPGVTAFDHVRYMCQFKGLQFFGGDTALHMKTGNMDTCLIDVENCVFSGQTHSCLRFDDLSGSTLFTARKSKFVTPSCGSPYVLYAESAGETVFEDCWVTAHSITGAAFYANAVLIFRNMLGVPGAHLEAWVDNYNLFTAENSRFGAEGAGGANTIVRNYASAEAHPGPVANGIVIQNCDVYTVGPVVKFFRIPSVVIITDNRGLADTKAFFVDPSVRAADLTAIGSEYVTFVVERNQFPLDARIDYKQGDPRAVKGLPFVCAGEKSLTSSPIAGTDVLVNSPGWNPLRSHAVHGGGAVSGLNDELGVSSYQFESTANGQSPWVDYDLALLGLDAGVLTAVLCFEVKTDNILLVQLRCGSGRHARSYGRGRHVISLPFYCPESQEPEVFFAAPDLPEFPGLREQSLTFECSDMPEGSQVWFTRFYVLRGHHQIKEKSIKLSQSAVPTTGNWYVGDTVINSALARGGCVAAWMCVTSSTADSAAKWRPTSWVTGKGKTASRPVLTENDVGVMYLDKTLSAASRPIWWSGSVWVDAMGSTV